MAIAGLTSKIAGLKDQLNTTYASIGSRTDDLISRLTAADARHAAAINAQVAEINSIDQGVAAIEALANSMTNGGPPLGGGSSVTSQADQNGVVVNKG